MNMYYNLMDHQILNILIYFSCNSYTYDIIEIGMGYSPHICWFAKYFGDKWKKLKLISFVQLIENNCTYY